MQVRSLPMLLAELVELDREAWWISEQERVSGPSWVSALVAVANRPREPDEGAAPLATD